MWEAFFAFHIRIACFSSESLGIPGYPQESVKGGVKLYHCGGVKVGQ
jgi:hypothetical protein